ncbi:hypothetical protein D3C81_1252270 [compost metagenome]
MPLVGVKAYRFSWLNACHWRLLENANTCLLGHLSHAANQSAWLHRRIATLIHARKMDIRTGSFCHLLPRDTSEGLDAETSTHVQRAVPAINVGRGCRCPEPAFTGVVGIDLMLFAELAKLPDSTLSGVSQEQRLFLGTEAQQGTDLRPPGHDETAITSRCPTTANILLQHNDVNVGVTLLEREGRPQANKATTDDCDVSVALALEGQCWLKVFLQTLQPIATRQRLRRGQAHGIDSTVLFSTVSPS